jgi:hypothetical protein
VTTEPDHDTLLTLDEIAQGFFRGTITKATLRAEIRRGNLTAYRVGRRDFTTIRDVRDMVERCRVEKHPPASISIDPVAHGQSGTAEMSSAQDALNETLKVLKKHCAPISPHATNRSAGRTL